MRSGPLLVVAVAVAACRAAAPATVTNPLPGAPPRDAALQQRLDNAAGAAAPGPRNERYTNRLILERSPYLVEHAHNPVDWWPWGDAAFAEARRLGRPVLLSVGYSTCHWCHVMERESFEDVEVARALNERYVCINVDREERPDLDAIYLAAVETLTGGGGWPMTLWLTPDREPYFGGTYFPARDGDRGARRGLLGLAVEQAERYRKEPETVARAARALTEQLRRGDDAPATGGAPFDRRPIDEALRQLDGAFDGVHGGLRRAPKFPSSLPVRLLLRQPRRDARALEMALVTLERMAAGGIYDQLGGGFHRYATDGAWRVPHFEKMLYDNALLALAYVEAHQLTTRADFARVAVETLDYLLREMAAPAGAFYAATDADSEGEEGRYFLWSAAEVQSLLGDDAARFSRYHGVSATGDLDGRNVLHVPAPDAAEWSALAPARARLLAARQRRVPPHRDDQIITAWNGLAISAFAVAGRVLGEPRYVHAAERAAELVLAQRRDQRLLRRDGPAAPAAFLADHAFLVAGLLDLHEATFDRRWLDEARALCETVEARFADRARGGWYVVADDAGEKLLARPHDSHDGAEPAASSVHALNLLRLAELTDEDRWRQLADRALAAQARDLATRPLAWTELLRALDFRTQSVKQVVLVWPPGATVAQAEPLLNVLRTSLLPAAVLTGGAEGSPSTTTALLAGRKALAGRATAYVCERKTCKLPTSDPSVLAEQLR